MSMSVPDISRKPGSDAWLDPFLPALQAAGPLLLELGCGPGEDAARLAVLGFRVVACDLSKKALRAAQGNVAAVEFFCADLSAPFPIRSATVGGVVSSLAIHYFPWRTTIALIAEARRVLQPGGIFVFRVNATDDHNFGAGQGEELEPNFYHVPPDGRNNRPYKRFFDAASIRALLTPGWHIEHLAHRTIYRYGEAKQVWECCARLDIA